jgi:hypothetical protein
VTVVQGAPVDISWQVSDGVTAPVDVQLVQGTRVVPLASKVPTPAGGTGTVRVSPALTAAPGTWSLRVRSSASALVSGSALGAVTLVRPTLAATAPTSGATWRHGTSVNLAWQLSGGAAVPVRAQLLRGTTVVATPASSGVTAAGGAGSASWTVPATLPAGSYVLRLRPVATASSNAVESTVSLTVGP